MTEQSKDLFQLERIPGCGIKWREEQKILINKLYFEDKVSINQISKLFNGLHYNTIKKILNGKLRDRAQSHYKDKRNENIFNVIDSEEKAYWLGFLAADGCVHGNYIRITLQANDIAHLEKFKKFINCDSVKIQFSKQVLKHGNIKEYATFAIGCKKMAEDLKRHGVIENKTLILLPPNIDNALKMAWIRGYFDGDGGLSYSRKSNRWQAYCNSTKEVLVWIVKELKLNCKPFNQQHYGKLDHVWRIHFNGRVNVCNAMDKIYNNTHANIYLDRKYQKYLQLKETFKN